MKLIDITVKRTIPARAEKVFDVWIDAKSRGSIWYGAERAIVNPIVDGLFYWAVQYEGRVLPHYGRFVRVERPRLLEYTWMSEGTKGLESVVTMTFEPRGEETEVTLRHAGLPDEEAGRKHTGGWEYFVGALAEVFAKQ